MLEESVTLANSTGQGNLQREDKVDRIHVLAPEERPARQEIIKKRLEMSIPLIEENACEVLKLAVTTFMFINLILHNVTIW